MQTVKKSSNEKKIAQFIFPTYRPSIKNDPQMNLKICPKTLHLFKNKNSDMQKKNSNGSGTLILSELDLTFIKNHNISVLPLLVLERVIFD